MTKRLFYPLFRESYKEAFTIQHIEHAFEKAGIWPLNPEKVIGPLRRLIPKIASPRLDQARTPLTCRVTRRTHRDYKLNPTSKKLALIFRGHEKLAAQDSIHRHMIKGLQQSLQIEKTKRKRGKRLNLLGQEETGPQFFTPDRVKAALAYQAQKEDEEELEKRVRIENKARKALEREGIKARKKLAIEERLQKRIQKRTQAESEKLQKAIERTERKAQLEENRALQRLDKARKTASKALNKASRAPKGKRKLVDSVDSVDSAPVAKRAIATNSRGRPVITPARYT